MTKKSRRTIAVCILCLMTVLVGFLFSLIKINSINTYAQLFSYGEEITMQTEQSLSNEYLNGKKGILFSTQKANKKISLTNQVAGDFEIEFTPVSSQKGQCDFSTVSFAFNSESERFGFVVRFNARENGVVGAVSLTHIENVTCEFFVEGSFCNTSDKAIKFYFSPKTMTLYNAEKEAVADFSSKEYMKQFGVVTTLSAFEKYTVDISFSNIVPGKQAKLLVFELCGQKLDKANLENSSAPMIVGEKSLSCGVVNKPYTIALDIATYDILDGFKDSFVGDIRVTDNQNMPIQVVNNQFTPTKSGIYYIHYTPKDSGGILGKEYSYSTFVFEEQPDIEMHYQYPFEELVIGKNTSVSFGKITASTLLQTESLTVKADIKLGDTVVSSIEDCGNGLSYTFDNVGTYTIVLQANDYIGYGKAEEYTVQVQDAPIFQNIQLKENYAKDTAINLSSVYLLYGSEVYESNAVKVKITYPNKTTKTSKTATLDQEGMYRVDFFAQVNGKDIAYVKYFTVKNNNESLWEPQDGLTITANAIAPDYADGNYVGTKLTVTRPIECMFKNVIDVSDNTKDDILTEILIAPSQVGTLETSCIDIILTDVYNPEKVVDIRLTSDVWGQIDKKDKTSVIAQPKRDFDNEYLRLLNANYGIYYYYTAMLKASLYGRIDSGNGLSPAQPIKFYFDYQTGQLYADMAVKGVETGKLLMADLSDPKYVGEGNIWDKFTTGEVEFSIKISKLAKDANLMVLNVDGQNLAGEFTQDTTQPSIFIDYEGNSETAVPYGIVNKPYAIFEAYARDLVGGTLQNINVSVYRKDGDALLEIPVAGKNFTPQQVGEYVIKYSVYDTANNYAEKTVAVSVKEEKDIPPKSYRFNDSNITNIFVGEYFRFYEGVATGGSGKLTTRMEILFDGQKIETDSDNGFVAEKAGTYTVSVMVSDYLGESNPFTYALEATYSSNAIVKEKTMPKAVILGEEFVIPQFEAFVYSAEGKKEVVPKIYVNGDEISGNVYTPTEAGTLAVDIVAEGTTYSYEVEVLTSQEKTETYTQRFFLTDAEISALTRSIVFTFDKEITIDVVRTIDVDFLNFVISSEEVQLADEQGENGELTVIPAGTNLTAIDCTITDSVDNSIKITFSLVKKDDKESYLVYGGTRYLINNASFDSYSKNFNVTFDNTTNQLYVGRLPVCELNTLDDGRSFNGFTSGKVYVSFAATPTAGKAAIGIVSVAGQSFNSTVKLDRIGPELKVLGDFSEVKLGDTLQIPAAKAFDFISGIKSVSVTVVSPNNEVLLNNADITSGKAITISAFGKYKIQYMATDGRGQIKEKNYTIGVLDTQPPEITVLGELPTAVNVGDVVTIPGMTATDNNSRTEEIRTYIYVIAPNAEMTWIQDNQFTADRKGEYVIIYVAKDKDNATATHRITVLVR